LSSFEAKLVRAVKHKREAEGLSIRALSAAVGVSFSTLARIERGDGQPDNNSRIRLLEWLGADAEKSGLRFENVAFVHFRAGKEHPVTDCAHLLKAADCLRASLGPSGTPKPPADPDEGAPVGSVQRSKEELEEIAAKFRSDLGLKASQALDSLKIKVDGVQVTPVGTTTCLDQRTINHLRGEASGEWSAMSVPLDSDNEAWAVLLNDSHTMGASTVTVLEEYWHILLGHKLTKDRACCRGLRPDVRP